MTTYHFDNDRLPGSAQWNGGMQVALPFSMSLDVSYVGQHSYDRPPACCSPQSLNSLDYGTAYLASSQDPTRQPSAVPGANALTQSLLAPYIGIGEINEWSQDFSRTFHSIQISGQRRFSRGFSGGLNYTWTLQDVSNEGVALRYEHGADGSVRLRSDQDEYEQLNNDVGTRTHQLKGNFVWDLPDVHWRANLAARVAAAVVNDWQVSAVWTGSSGNPFNPTFTYQTNGSNQNLTGSPHYAARIVLNGTPTGGCDDR